MSFGSGGETMSTIYDVAKKAGVSASTVSLAFNQPHKIKAETKERVYKAAQDLNYEANSFARVLAGGRSKQIAFLPTDIRFPSSSSIYKGLEELLSQEGFLTLIANTDGDVSKAEKTINKLIANGVSGFVFNPAQYGFSADYYEIIKQITEEGISVVTLGHESSEIDIEHISYQPQLAVQEAIDYLIELGHVDIGMIGGIPEENIGLPRYLGYCQSLLSNGIALNNAYHFQGKLTPETGFQGLEHLMALPKPPTAIFALNDVVATGVIDACLKLHIELPNELSVISFESGGLYGRSTPAITSIIMPAYEIGRQAALSMINRWEKPESEKQNKVVRCGFEIRETTAPPQVSSKVLPKLLQTVK